MEDLRQAYIANGGTLDVLQSNGLGNNNQVNIGGEKNERSSTNRVEMKISAVNRVWGGDKRLALFGYTLETINMLLFPMIQTK